MEVRQLPRHRNDRSQLNRGIIALSSIQKRDILGDYVGDFVPLDAKANYYDQTYMIEFDGPMHMNPDKKREWDLMASTCCLSAGTNGNWTRFMNSDEDVKKINVELTSHAIAGQLRIIAVALRDIGFGEELLTSYGDHYFEDSLYSPPRKREVRCDEVAKKS